MTGRFILFYSILLYIFKFLIQEFLTIKTSSTTFFCEFCVCFFIDSLIVSIEHQLSVLLLALYKQ